MKRIGLFAIVFFLWYPASASAQAEYVAIEMEIDVARPAADVWAEVGGYCDISKWLNNIDCTITSGNGGVGTVRSLAGGRVTEVLVALTELGYGYAQPAVEGEFYNMYHGFLEARPTGPNSSRLLYTLMVDVSNLPDQAAKDADVARRRATFEAALATMKQLAEN
jgi:Polyketide cyclase / dehydrase and lipid transport